MPGHTYTAYNATVSGTSVTIGSTPTGATANVGSFTITDTSSGGNGVLGDGATATFTASKTIDGVTHTGTWTYLGTVTINGLTGFVAESGGNTVFFQNYTLAAPASGSSGALLPASSDPMQQDADWNVSTAAPAQPCFVTGTRILTTTGLVEVEKLAAGDMVVTEAGTAAPIRWVGRSTVSRMFADPVRTLPILIKAGALGENMPQRDLAVSPGHALVLDGVLVQAGALVNGTTIIIDSDAEMVFDYYHIELDNHDVLIAEGVPTESFLDGIEAMNFANVESRPSRTVPMVELAMPRVKAARQVPAALKARIAARASILVDALDAAA